jgi:hypothetical protein
VRVTKPHRSLAVYAAVLFAVLLATGAVWMLLRVPPVQPDALDLKAPYAALVFNAAEADLRDCLHTASPGVPYDRSRRDIVRACTDTGRQQGTKVLASSQTM